MDRVKPSLKVGCSLSIMGVTVSARSTRYPQHAPKTYNKISRVTPTSALSLTEGLVAWVRDMHCSTVNKPSDAVIAKAKSRRVPPAIPESRKATG
eukprot:scaffold292492_cov36-Tisochrysis_lutea.AAC.1